MSRIQSIRLRVNHTELGLEALLEESREGEEPVYDEANDWYDWSRVDAKQMDRAELVITALERIARAGLERQYPGAAVDVECSADTIRGVEVDPEEAEELVQNLVDTRLAAWVDEAWDALSREGGASGGDAP